MNTREKAKWSRGGVTYGTIFVRPAITGQSLKSFATEIFAWLEVSQFEEDLVGRDYDHQIFVGSAIGIIVCIGENGLKTLNKYPFEISLSLLDTKQAADYLAQHAHMLAWRLSHEGFRCFVPKSMLNLGNDEQDGMVYDA